MSEVKSLRFNSPELENWVDEHVEKGELNALMNHLLQRYRQEQEQEYVEQDLEEKAEERGYLFQMVMFMMIGMWMLVFALSQFFDVFSIIATVMLIFCGILLCFYVIMRGFKPKLEQEVTT
jgi:apolipoprotein N-acyltransferase